MRFLDLLLRRRKRARIENGNTLLVQAMHEVALNDTPSNRRILYENFLDSMLLIPVTEIPKGLKPGIQTTAVNIEVPITTLVDRNQLRITPAFTDADALRNWDPNTPYIAIKAQELCRLIMGTYPADRDQSIRSH